MARRKTSHALVRSIPAPARAQVIKLNVPRAPSAPRHKKRHHRRHAVSGGMNTKSIIGAALAGAVLGFIEAKFPNIPSIPLVGRKGTIAIAAYYLGKRGGPLGGPITRDVAMVAAGLAGYDLGKTGKISGEDVSGDDVSGDLAAQM